MTQLWFSRLARAFEHLIIWPLASDLPFPSPKTIMLWSENNVLKCPMVTTMYSIEYDWHRTVAKIVATVDYLRTLLSVNNDRVKSYCAGHTFKLHLSECYTCSVALNFICLQKHLHAIYRGCCCPAHSSRHGYTSWRQVMLEKLLGEPEQHGRLCHQLRNLDYNDNNSEDTNRLLQAGHCRQRLYEHR